MRCRTCHASIGSKQEERASVEAPSKRVGHVDDGEGIAWPHTHDEATRMDASWKDKNDVEGSEGSGGSLEACLARLLDVSEEDDEEKRKVLNDVFRRASDEAQVNFPICIACANEKELELDRSIADAELEAEMYRASIRLLDQERASDDGKPTEELEEELRRSLAEEEQHQNELKRVEDEISEVNAHLIELNAQVQEMEKAEESYWREFNSYKMQLHFHLEDKDALMHRLEIASAQLKLLQRSNVYNDVFYIWYEGPFGTINGCRMGSMPNDRVEWEEINAGWGQCVFLLHIMARTCQLGFSRHKLLPMGSFPRISDGKVTFELFGPVSVLNPFGGASKYDKGATAFLSCLQEFADFALARDKAAGQDVPFRLPFPIEGERIGGKSIRYSFNSEEKWTAALKLLLANLKVSLAWFIQNFGELDPVGGNLLRS